MKTVDQLVDLYFASVGRNSKLLLNVPPARDGLLHETDVSRLAGLHERLTALFREDLAAGRRPVWRRADERRATAEIDLGRAVAVGLADLREEIAGGQAVAQYSIEGFDEAQWRRLARGTTIGNRKLDRFAPVPVRRVRVVIEHAVAPPQPLQVGLYS